MASTSPAPNSGIGDPAREHRRLVGHDGLAAMPGTENNWKSVSPDWSKASNSPSAVLRADTELEDGAGAADDGDVVAHGAARAVERRAEALVGRLDLEEVVEAEPELRELCGRDAGERLPRLRHPVCATTHAVASHTPATARAVLILL